MIGALLGGALNRYGERSFDQLQRDRQLEDWGRQTSLSTLIGHFEKNYDNMLPDEQEAMLSQIEAHIPGAKKGTLSPMVQGVKGFHAILPPPPEPYMPPQQERTKLDEPRPISAPIYQPMPTQEISLPAQTPGQVKAKRLYDQQAAERQRMLKEVSRISELPPEYKQMITAGMYGLKGAPAYEVGMENADVRRRIAEDKAKEFRGAARLIVRNGMPLPVKGTGKDEFILDPQQGWVAYVPQEGDQPYEKPTPLGTVTGAKDVYSFDKKTGETKALGVGVAPRSSTMVVQPGQADVTTVADMVARGEIKPSEGASMLGGQRTGGGIKLAAELKKRGLLATPTKIREQRGALQQARNLIAPMEQLTEAIIRGENIVENTVRLEQYSQSVGTLLARTIGGEKGVATDKDVQRALGLVPGWKAANFAPEYARQNIALLKNIVDSQDQALGTYFNTSAIPEQDSQVRRQQFSKSTGQYRYSLDGGKTWQPGRLPK